MRKNAEATPEDIRTSLEPISNDLATRISIRNYLETQESSLTTDNRFLFIGSASEDYGDSHVAHGYRNAIVTKRLLGERVLRKGSLVRHESFVLADDMSVYEDITSLIEFRNDDSLARKKIGMIALKEWRGNIFSFKAVEHQNYYFESDQNGIEVAVEGLSTYLNDAALDMHQSELIENGIKEAMKRVEVAKLESWDRVQKAMINRR